MTAALLLLLPVAMALAALAIPSNRLRPLVLPIGGFAHLGLTIAALLGERGGHTPDAWFGLDLPGRLVLGLISPLFAVCGVYAVGYLRHRGVRPNRIFVACLSALLGALTLVIFSRHLGLMWVAVEASALCAGPLIYFNRTARSIEATWKYLLVGSVGVALALLGSFFLAYSALQSGQPSSLIFDDLFAIAPRLSKPWLHAAFVLLLVGYGTKMGLAPMHTWKPDAYGEASGVVGAVLAGGVTSAAFLAILRVVHLCNAAGEGPFVSRLLILLGLVSMAVAGAFMVGQRDFKRMLAYSSVEHMGILALGVGVGGPALFGALLHLVNNAFTKGVMFLSAGNIQRAYGSKSTTEVHGALTRLPFSATLFFAGFLAVTGSPPFGPFVSELTILTGTFGAGRFVTGGLFLFFLLVVFVGMGQTVLSVTQGTPPAEDRMTGFKDNVVTGLPVLGLLLVVLCLGLWVPAPLETLLRDTAAWLEVAR